MADIDRLHLIDSHQLSGVNYFTSLLSAAYAAGLLFDADIEKLQIQCLELLGRQCENYSGGHSSSVRVEVAETIMKSNLYALGVYLKSLTDADLAASQLQTEEVAVMYQKGRKILAAKLNTARQIYGWIQNNKIDSPNEPYNTTIGSNGLGRFFKKYNPDYEATEITGSLDYPLGNPVADLTGIEYVQKYLESLYYENEFCQAFSAARIDRLLLGWAKDYQDLPINIFEKVLTSALGCVLAGKDPLNLNLSRNDQNALFALFTRVPVAEIAEEVELAADKLLQITGCKKPALRRYISKNLVQVGQNIIQAIKTDTLPLLFPALMVVEKPDPQPQVRFISAEKMADDQYRKLIAELLECRLASDKLALVQERVRTFGDLEDVLLDAGLTSEEIARVLGTLGDIEIAVLLKRHPAQDGQAPDQWPADQDAEFILSSALQKHVGRLATNRQKQILDLVESLVID
jgi:hypothetical protein